MKKVALLITIILALSVAPAASAQRLNIDVPADLAQRASESVDVTLDGPMLKLAARFMNDERDPDARAVRDMVRGLQGIYVRSYEFDKEGEYDRAIISRLRSQLGPSWKKIVTVASREKENVEIYVDAPGAGDKINGLLILSAEPKELTIVNLVGPVDIDRLSSLEGQFGIPRMSGRGKGRSHDHD